MVDGFGGIVDNGTERTRTYMSIVAFAALSREGQSFLEEVLPVGQRTGNRARQGRGLVSLGHAVEYLVDSRLFDLEAQNVRDEQEAVQILKRMSRAIFAECVEVMSDRRRTDRWVRVSCGSGLAAQKWCGGKTA